MRPYSDWEHHEWFQEGQGLFQSRKQSKNKQPKKKIKPAAAVKKAVPGVKKAGGKAAK